MGPELSSLELGHQFEVCECVESNGTSIRIALQCRPHGTFATQ